MRVLALRRFFIAGICVVIGSLIQMDAVGQSGGPYEIKRSVVAGGGGASSGGTFSLEGTIGQTVAGGPIAASPFTAHSGFWYPGIAGWNIGGEIIYGTSPTKRVPGVNLALTGSSTGNIFSSGTGAYQFGGLLDGGSYTITPTKTTDANGISSLDASQVARHVAGIITLTPDQQAAGDASNSGSLSSLDAAQIARFVAGFITNIGVTGQWKFLPPSRTYNSLSNNAVGENYTGILVGEVTGSWVQPGGLAETDHEVEENMFRGTGPSALNNGAPSTRISGTNAGGVPVTLPTNATVSTGTAGYVIPITTGPLDEVFSYDLHLTYDPTVLTPAVPAVDRTGTLSEDANGGCGGMQVNTTTPGLMIVASPCPSGLSGSGTLLNLRFNVIGVFPQSTALTWTGFAIPFACPGGFCYDEDSVPTAPANGLFTVQGPTAAAVSVSGRVATAAGYGIPRVRVSLGNTTSGEVRSVYANFFGYYNFVNVGSGQIYIVSVGAKRYRFKNPTQVILVQDEISNLDFIALP